MKHLCLTKKNFSLKKILIVAFVFFMSVIKTLKIENVVVIADTKNDKYYCSNFFHAKLFFDQTQKFHSFKSF